MARRKALRFLKWFLISALALVLLIALTFSLWFPPLLSHAAKRFGVTYSKLEKLENNRFAAHDIKYSSPAIDLVISRAEGLMPLTWYRTVSDTNAIAQSLEGTNTPTSFLQINGWKLVVKEKPDKQKPESNTNSVYAIYEKAEKGAAQLRKWLPRAELLNGFVVIQDKEYSVPLAIINQGKVDLDGTWPESAAPFTLKANLSGAGPFQASFAMTTLDIRTRLQAWKTNDLVRAKLTGNWKESRMVANADFGPDGMLPIVADVSVPQFEIPGEMARMPAFNQIKGSLKGSWETNQFAVSTTADAIPLAGDKTNIPPLHIEAKATGNTNELTIQELQVTGVDTEIRLTTPLKVTFKGELLTSQAILDVQSKLESLPWIQASGIVTGKVQATKSGKIPDLQLQLSGTNITGYGIAAQNLQVKGSLKWPFLEKAEVTMLMTEGGKAMLNLQNANLTNKSLAHGELLWNGHFVHPKMPTNISYTNLSLQATVSGSLTQWVHQADVSLYRLDLPQLKPLDIKAKWSGTNVQIADLRFQAQAGPSILALTGSVEPTTTTTNLTIKTLNLLKGEEPELTLAKPATVSYQSQQTETNRLHTIHVSSLEWLGKTNGIRMEGNVTWPQQGNVKIRIDSFDPDIFGFFTERSLGGIDIQGFQTDLRWNDTAVMGSITGKVSVVHSKFQKVSVSLAAQADEEGLLVHDLLLTDQGGKVVEAVGFLPLKINPLAKTKKVDLARSEQFSFKARTLPNTNFWRTISEMTKVRLGDPQLDLSLKGTAREPEGHIVFNSSDIELSKIKKEIPDIQNVALDVFINEKEARLEHLSLALEKQPITAKGTVALGSNFWHTTRANINDHVLENSSIELQARNFQVAPFTKFAPQYLVPQGALDVDVSILPGKNAEGKVSFTNIATRPIGSLGPVDAIRGKIHFNGRQVEIQKFAAILGGEQLNVAGRLDLSEEKMATGYPGINMKLQGKNLPLARNPQIILRSDLDLTISNGATNVPVVSGKVNLQDSFFLSDLESLIPGKVSRPEKRPPYFSIDRDPLGAWKLDVRVTGTDFMRVRSPFFQGQVSAAFHVIGTLAEPTALGESQISQGQIKFPFANLDVKQGIVSLTSDNPYVPQVFVLAGARTFGYDVTMEARGPANELIIEFTSVPSLTSEEIVLMLTTGALPRSDFSFSNEQKASKLAMFLGKSLWSKFSGDDGGTERLSIRSGEDISEQGRQTYNVEYRLSEKWSLIGEYDRFGAVNAGLKWKVLTR